MSRNLLGVIGLSSLLITTHSSAVRAADIPVKARPAAVAESWTGCYLGGNFGGGWASETGVRLDNPSGNFPVGSSATRKQSGILGGGQVGCDYQSNGFVVGVVASADVANLTGTQQFLGALGTVNSTQNSKISWITDVGARVGIPWGNWLAYAKGGGAWIHYESTGLDTALPGGAFLDTTTQAKTFNGWFGGLGAEYKISHNLSAFTEWNHYGFKSNVLVTVVVGPPGSHTNSQLGHVDVLKAGLNYRFDVGR